ncbi:MAG: hypothetical protein HY918_01980 [Candidatus Doudnabacteria bacterium]|nr:hypothetical protein [Candidatus Doudnabacteria bacterium]
MSEQTNCDCHKAYKHHHGALGGAYGLAVLGAAVYYIQHSATFWAGVLGVLKALIWPALVIYKLLDFLKM